jgi:hypothetical protein
VCIPEDTIVVAILGDGVYDGDVVVSLLLWKDVGLVMLLIRFGGHGYIDAIRGLYWRRSHFSNLGGL